MYEQISTSHTQTTDCTHGARQVVRFDVLHQCSVGRVASEMHLLWWVIRTIIKTEVKNKGVLKLQDRYDRRSQFKLERANKQRETGR